MRYSASTGTFYPKNTEYKELPADLEDVSIDDAALAMNRKQDESFEFVNGSLVITSLSPVLDTELTKEQKIKAAESAVTDMMNAEALKEGYKNDITGQGDIKSAALRAGYPGPYQAQGIKYATWMDACWAKCYQILDDVEAKKREEPTNEELLAEMPTLVL